jgi:hypothetical protein
VRALDTFLEQSLDADALLADVRWL